MSASAGIREAAERCSATLRVVETENDAQSAADKLSQYLDRQKALPDVLIVGNNPILLGSLKQLQQRQIAIQRIWPDYLRRIRLGAAIKSAADGAQ